MVLRPVAIAEVVRVCQQYALPSKRGKSVKESSANKKKYIPLLCLYNLFSMFIKWSCCNTGVKQVHRRLVLKSIKKKQTALTRCCADSVFKTPFLNIRIQL